VIFVADSDPDKMKENIESYENLIENLDEYGKDVRELPHVLQYNKRDLPNAMAVDEMDRQLNRFGVPTFEAVANTGEGVFPTIKVLAGMVLESIDRMDSRRAGGAKSAPQAAAPAGPGAGEPAAATDKPAARPRRKVAAQPRGERRGESPPKGQRRRPGAPAGKKGGGPRPAAARPPRARTNKQAAARPTPQPKRGGGAVTLAVLATLFIAAAVAGVVYFVAQNQG